MGNAAVLMNILLPLLQNANEITALLARAHSEGRDVTDAELTSLFADDDVARIKLEAAIKTAKGQ